MKRCSVRPYEGDEQYIFVSYCHKDKAYVFPIIERLAKDGYRVWYDEGIDPGSEWPEIIAHHLNGCAACIAFITENSLNSHNCRREINFALLKKKSFLSIVLEEVHMSLGMEMQLSATQSIFKYTLSSNEEFFKKMYEAKFLKNCMGTPDPSIVISSAGDYKDNKKGLFEESNLRRDTFSDKWFLDGEASGDNTPVVSEKKVLEVSAEGEVKKLESVFEIKDIEEVSAYEAWLVRTKTNETIPLKLGKTKLGRSNTMADYAIVGNSAIGRFHAYVENTGSECRVVDNNSMNKTFLNAKELEPEKEYLLEDGDAIRLANEKFTFHQKKS